MNHRRIGLDDVAAYVPRLYLDMEEFAERRGIPSSHITKGVGLTQMAIPDNHEDAATMAANAVLKLLRKNDLEPNQIGRIYVGTETQEDRSKPIASKVVGMLEGIYGQESFSHVGAVDHVFACAGASYALESVLDWIEAGRDGGKKGIVVATDIARYELRSNGEYTQGAGAVAMLVDEDPRLIEMRQIVGNCTRHEKDFFNPPEKETPVVDGKYSIAVYLDAVKTAYFRSEFRQKFTLEFGLPTNEARMPLSDYIDYLVFHLPFPEMAKYASASLFMREWRGSERWKKAFGQTDSSVKSQEYTVNDLLSDDYRDLRKKFTASPAFQEVYAKKVYPSTLAGRRIGNSYNASMYLAFLGLTEWEYGGGADLVGKRILYASYGSGCTAKVSIGVYSEKSREVAKQIHLVRELDERQRISFDDYERLRAQKAGRGDGILQPHAEFGISSVGQSLTDYGFRYYKYF